MPDTPTPPDPNEFDAVIAYVADEAARYLDGVADRDVRSPKAGEAPEPFGGPLPEAGVGARAALEELVAGIDGAVHSAGPKYFHFVNGGGTPAARGGGLLPPPPRPHT